MSQSREVILPLRILVVGHWQLQRRLRVGLTLIELVVVCVIIALMIGLLIPAVQFAREVARRNMCASNLRQISLGVANYEAANRCFPPGWTPEGSYLVSILPFIEQSAVAEKVREHRRLQLPRSSFKIVLPIFKCPSDPQPAQIEAFNGQVGTNYFGNSGSYAGTPRGFDGIFRMLESSKSRLVRAADVSDGLSSTSCLSETLHADGSLKRMRCTWNLPRSQNNYLDLAHVCRSIPNDPEARGWRGDNGIKGVPWFDGGHMVTLFNHVCIPNSPSCFNGADVDAGASTVASYHSGLCNVAFADGHISMVSSNIDARAWFGFGSIGAGDLPVSKTFE